MAMNILQTHTTAFFTYKPRLAHRKPTPKDYIECINPRPCVIVVLSQFTIM